NTPPTLTAVPTATLTVDQPFTFTAIANDADAGQVLTLSAANLPPGATFPGSTGTGTQTSPFNWTPTLSQVGVWNIPSKVTDTGAPPLTTTIVAQLTVIAGNHPPHYTQVANQTVGISDINAHVFTEQVATFDAIATDADASDLKTLTYSMPILEK